MRDPIYVVSEASILILVAEEMGDEYPVGTLLRQSQWFLKDHKDVGGSQPFWSHHDASEGLLHQFLKALLHLGHCFLDSPLMINGESKQKCETIGNAMAYFDEPRLE